MHIEETPNSASNGSNFDVPFNGYDRSGEARSLGVRRVLEYYVSTVNSYSRGTEFWDRTTNEQSKHCRETGSGAAIHKEMTLKRRLVK